MAKRIRDLAKQREYAQRHYAKNRDRMIARAKVGSAKDRVARIALLSEHLTTHPCIDCGEADPIVLEFDHRDPSTKSFNVGDAHRRYLGLQTVRDEIAKCDVRCANCHRRRTYVQRGFTHKG